MRFGIFIAFIIIAACQPLKEKSAGVAPQQVFVGSSFIAIDTQSENRFSESEQNFLATLFNQFATLRFNLPSDHVFHRMFQSVPGNSPLEKMQKFATDRIRYFAKKSTSTSTNSIIMAENISGEWLSSLWNSYVAKGTATNIRPIREVNFNNTKLRFDRPIGYIELAGGMFDANIQNIRKIATIIHEARHSDCAQLPQPNELTTYFSNGNTDQMNVFRKCLNLHVKCPTNHALAGTYACDAHVWGSYSVNVVFMNAVANHCDSCSPSDKVMALAWEKDARSRILTIDQMTSSGNADLSNVDFQP